MSDNEDSALQSDSAGSGGKFDANVSAATGAFEIVFEIKKQLTAGAVL